MKIALSLLFSATSIFAQLAKVENVMVNVPASFRALSVVDDKIVWVSGSKGHVGKSLDGGKTWDIQQLKNYESLDFRSCYAFDSKNVIIANAGSPAHILKTADGGQTWKVVYSNYHKEAFFDGIDFWNDRDGIIFGDPVNSKMLMLRTYDSGETWTPVATSPVLKEGEASFAASGTTIRCMNGTMIVVATGGKSSRLWVSEDGGATWKMIETQMVQGSQGSGIFSVAWNKNVALMVGGNFENDKSGANQSFYSNDNGKIWQPSETYVRGWRECAEFIEQTMWITTGPNGMEISYDDGKNWNPFSDEKDFHVIRKARKGKQIVAAGNKKIALINP